VSPLAAIRLGCGFLRSKVSALFLGAAGLGLLGQGNQFLLIITSLGSLGMVNSMMQQISRHRESGDPEMLRKIKSTVLISQCISLAIMVAVLLFTLRQLGFFLFNNTTGTYSGVLVLIICTAPLNVLASNYLEGFFVGYQRFDLYIRASSITAILGLVIFVPCVYWWGVKGGLINIAIGEVTLFVLFLYHLLKIERLKEIFVFRFDMSLFKGMFTDGMINLACGTLQILFSLLVRQMIISQKGEFFNGIYQFSTSITAYYAPFITNMLWAKYFPEISAKGITATTAKMLEHTILFISLATTAVITAIMVYPQLMIRILASAEFEASQRYLALQFAGDFWYFIFYSYTVFLLAMRDTRKYLILWLLFLATQYVGVKLMIGYRGIDGVMIAYVISSVLMGGVALIHFARLLGKHLSFLVTYLIMLVLFLIVVSQSALTVLE
jgi:O-antigen/teichoic acid export membrane protein